MHYIVFLGVAQESKETNPNKQNCRSKEKTAGIVEIAILKEKEQLLRLAKVLFRLTDVLFMLTGMPCCLPLCNDPQDT